MSRAPGALRAATGALAVGLCALLSGCASTTKIYVQSTDRTNAGNVLHMMVREVDAKTAATTELYQEAGAMLFAPERDESIVVTQPVFPGKPATATVNQSPGKILVLYFFFTSPGDHWRVQVGNPMPAEVLVELGLNQIAGVQVRR